MSRDVLQSGRELVELALQGAGWSREAPFEIAPGRVNLTGGAMYDAGQRIVADALLRQGRMPLAVLALTGPEEAAAGGERASAQALRLGLRFSLASDGRRHVLTDNRTGEHEPSDVLPGPEDLLRRLGHDPGGAAWRRWRPVFDAPWQTDSGRPVRPYQEMAIGEALSRFARGERRVLLLLASGTGKTFTALQLVAKLFAGGVLPHGRVLYLTDRARLKEQAWQAFAAFGAERTVLDRETIARGEPVAGKVAFANYQDLEELHQGRKLYARLPPDTFDLVVVDECYRSGFGDWFGVLQHFGDAFQLGLTATPPELDRRGRRLSPEELCRDTFVYFTGSEDGLPAYLYTLKQAIEDGYAVPYLLEERIHDLDDTGFTGPDGRRYATRSFERDLRLPDQTRRVAEDLWQVLGRYQLREEKSIIFCVDDTHAALMAAELRRLSGDPGYAALVTRTEREAPRVERGFATVGPARPRVAVTVDLLAAGFDAPDVRSVVLVRPLRSFSLYKQMKGRATRLCAAIDKRYCTVFDYVGATQLEDGEFDGEPADRQQRSPRQKVPGEPVATSVGDGVTVLVAHQELYVCLASGRKVPFDVYLEHCQEVVRALAPASLPDLLRVWRHPVTRRDLRFALQEKDVHVAALRHLLELAETDDVDILAKLGFDLVRVPSRPDRVARFWDQEDGWLLARVGEQGQPDGERQKCRFWQACLDHYAFHGIDELEQGATYSTPEFTRPFGSFSRLLERYGGPAALKDDLEAVKEHLYVPLVA
ncbi:MAG TPA: DEAD/DEAH box helicase family protein [Thermoanaerobaculia bacterium]|nr:DEAD/DEAH box helicase family protein [Thermoanaerobaculia bacterium]